MKPIYYLIAMTFMVNICTAQVDDKYLKYQSIDSDYYNIIFNNLWEFESIITEKTFSYKFKKYSEGVYYDFETQKTKMCQNESKQEINTSWVFVSNDLVYLTFEVNTEATQWVFKRVDSNTILVKNYVPKHPKKQSTPYTKYKYGKQMFYFKKVDSTSCS